MPSMTRKQMIDFLSDHFRYHTMHSRQSLMNTR